MTTVTLELRAKDAANVPSTLVGAYGGASGTPHVVEKLCSDLEFPQIERYLDTNKIPYKVGNPSGVPLVRKHGADW